MRLFGLRTAFIAAAACAAVCAAIGWQLAVTDNSLFLDGCAAERVKDADAVRIDKTVQAIFFVLIYIVHLISCAALRWSRRAAFFLHLRFFASYGLRSAVYALIVLPLGKSLPFAACGTDKSISGHAHMFIFHILLLLVHNWLLIPLLFSGSSTAVQIAGGVSALALQVGSMALSRTLRGGFHSLRHVLLGGVAALATLGVYMVVDAALQRALLPATEWSKLCEVDTGGSAAASERKRD
eukprot:PLAT123.1.p1 GENE.PLAT123.1~~PLAT123.1.p1  ORF type:complete len:239 (+),score=95.64 PLAT123.1:36-752(+)